MIPDFEKLAAEYFPHGVSQGPDRSGHGLRILLAATLRATWNAAIEEAAGTVDANASDIMDGASGEWLVGKIRALKATP